MSFETRYQPRDIVGGDFFCIERLGADHYIMLVADARGHGVAAALYTMLLRSLWQEHRAELASPARFILIVKEGLLQLACSQVVNGGGSGFHLDKLEEQLLRFSNQIHLPDDLTLIKLHRLC